MKVPFGEMEYVNEFWIVPFSLTGMGLPEVSKISIRPEMVLDVVFTRPNVVAQLPDIANCENMTAFVPPTVPPPVTFL